MGKDPGDCQSPHSSADPALSRLGTLYVSAHSCEWRFVSGSRNLQIYSICEGRRIRPTNARCRQAKRIKPYWAIYRRSSA